MSQFKNERTALNRIVTAAKDIYGICLDKKSIQPRRAIMSIKHRHVFFQANRKYEVLTVKLPIQEDNILIVCDAVGNVGIFKKADLAKITFVA